jgi:putative glutamine amidotransferase
MKLGLSMRHAVADGYSEERDAISRSWYFFLQRYLPESKWMPLPNLPRQQMQHHLEVWRLKAFLLTGGPEVGVDPQRDEAEATILRYALENNLPAIGVCRGFQFIHQYLGGSLRSCPPTEHVATRHRLLLHRSASAFIGRPVLEVNSFHRFGILATELAAPLQTLAQIGDWVEWAAANEPRLMGMMWHPERPGGSPEISGRAIWHFLSNSLE